VHCCQAVPLVLQTRLPRARFGYAGTYGNWELSRLAEDHRQPRYKYTIAIPDLADLSGLLLCYYRTKSLLKLAHPVTQLLHKFYLQKHNYA
jgi:hypothetical protein